LLHEGIVRSKQHHQRSLLVRYKGQSFELEIKQTRGDIAAAFHRAHRARYGHAQERNTVEIVSARVRSIGAVEKFKTRRFPVSSEKGFAKPGGYAESYFEGTRTRAAVYQREQLPAGARLRVPCIVSEYSATTLIPKDARANVDRNGNLILEVERPWESVGAKNSARPLRSLRSLR